MSSHTVKKKSSSAGLLSFPSGHDDVENVDPSSCTHYMQGKELARTADPGTSKVRSTNASRLPRPRIRYPLRTIPAVSKTHTVKQVFSSEQILEGTKIASGTRCIETEEAPKGGCRAESFQPKSPRPRGVAQVFAQNVTRRRKFSSPFEYNISSIDACALIPDTEDSPKKIINTKRKNTVSERDNGSTVEVENFKIQFNSKHLRTSKKCSTPIEKATENIVNNNQKTLANDLNNNAFSSEKITISSHHSKNVTSRGEFADSEWPPCKPTESAFEEGTYGGTLSTHVTQFLRREKLLSEENAGPSGAQTAFEFSQAQNLSPKKSKGPRYTPFAHSNPQQCPEDTYSRPKRVKSSLARSKGRNSNNNTLSTPPSPKMPIFRTPPVMLRRAPSLVPPSLPADLPTLYIYQGLPDVSSAFVELPETTLLELAETGKEPGIVNFDDKAPPMDKGLLLSLEYQDDIMEHLHQREKAWLRLTSVAHNFDTLSEINRSILVNWLVKLNCHMRGDEGLLETGVRLTDRALAVAPVPIHAVQLLALACYWIARKLRTARPGAASRLVRYCNGAYTQQELKAEECRVMLMLHWPSLPPTSDSWVPYMVHRERARDATLVARAAQYLVCGALLHAGLASLPPSRLAGAGVTAALYLLEGRSIPRLAMCTAEHDDSACVNKGDLHSSLVCELLHVARKLRSPVFLCREPFIMYCHSSRDAVALRVSAKLDK